MTYREALEAIIETPLYKWGVGSLNDALEVAVKLLREKIEEEAAND